MKLLYSNILPLGTDENQQTITDCFEEQLSKADRIEIAVGYVSRASLDELDRLVEKYNIKNICLNIGMYYIEGMPEGSYHTALKLNKKWISDGKYYSCSTTVAAMDMTLALISDNLDVSVAEKIAEEIGYSWDSSF